MKLSNMVNVLHFHNVIMISSGKSFSGTEMINKVGEDHV